MGNACFCFSRLSILASKIDPKIMLFQDAFLDTLFLNFILLLFENAWFWDPFKIQWAPTLDPKSTMWHQNIEFSTKPQHLVIDLWPRSIFWCILVALWLTFGTLLNPWAPKRYPNSTCGAKMSITNIGRKSFSFECSLCKKSHINQHDKATQINIHQHSSKSK